MDNALNLIQLHHCHNVSVDSWLLFSNIWFKFSILKKSNDAIYGSAYLISQLILHRWVKLNLNTKFLFDFNTTQKILLNANNIKWALKISTIWLIRSSKSLFFYKFLLKNYSNWLLIYASLLLMDIRKEIDANLNVIIVAVYYLFYFLKYFLYLIKSYFNSIDLIEALFIALLVNLLLLQMLSVFLVICCIAGGLDSIICQTWFKFDSV